MSSFHERFFRKSRWGNFYPRGPKAKRYAWPVFAGVIGLMVLGMVLLGSGHELLGQIILGAIAILFVIYNGFVATRSDL